MHIYHFVFLPSPLPYSVRLTANSLYAVSTTASPVCIQLYVADISENPSLIVHCGSQRFFFSASPSVLGIVFAEAARA